MQTYDSVGIATDAYVECAKWTDVNEYEIPSARMRREAREVVGTFIESNQDLVDLYLNERSLGDLGHDLWLTRNGHGEGFWSRGLGDVGNRLADAAYALGEGNAYLGSDGFVYVDYYPA